MIPNKFSIDDYAVAKYFKKKGRQSRIYGYSDFYKEGPTMSKGQKIYRLKGMALIATINKPEKPHYESFDFSYSVNGENEIIIMEDKNEAG